jgi:oxygen-independent coproporphyrinogen-3 oxidase
LPGLYLHIPFCKQACHYCNFHFSTSLKQKDRLINALKKEIEIRHQYLDTKSLRSIYFGGGTPSLLSRQELIGIFEQIGKYFQWDNQTEITLEANPDDLTPSYLNELSNTPVNRLSIGIQSFFEEDLKYMNRAHSADEALNSILLAQDIGFKNFSIDLIYGTPTLSDAGWEKNLERVYALNIDHLSAYALTVESMTALDHLIRKQKVPGPNEEHVANQFSRLIQIMREKEWIHYEISNFAKDGFVAIHNTSYWKGKSYLGIGPSAHSYNGYSRQWNTSNNMKYIRALDEGTSFYEKEVLSPEQHYHEYLLTGLRTMWGVRLAIIKKMGQVFFNHFTKQIPQLLNQGDLIRSDEGRYTLSEKGKLYADRITGILFMP